METPADTTKEASGENTEAKLSAGENIAAGLDKKPPSVASPVKPVTPKPDAENPATDANSSGDMTAMKKRLAELEAKENATTERRKAEDFTNEFIRSDEKVCKWLPAAMLRKHLPVSSDEKVLRAAADELMGWVKDAVSRQVATGLLYHRTVGSGNGGGGEAISGVPLNYNQMTAPEKIAAGLARQRQS